MLADFRDAFADLFPLLLDLEHCQQDPAWHAEGNVAVHTQMVLEHCYQSLERSSVSEHEASVLILAALFHDIAKPLTTRTREINAQLRIISPRHADRGRSYCAYKLLDLGINAATARQVMALIGHHHDPKQLIVRDKPISQYRRLARLAPVRLLYWLEQADMRGRIGTDLEEQLDTLELFKLICQEENLWGGADPYQDWKAYLKEASSSLSVKTSNLITANAIRDYEQEQIYTPHEAMARSYEYRDSYAELTIVCGPSGSGKTTWIRENCPEHVVISLDQLREVIAGRQSDQSKNGQVVQRAKEMLKDGLRKHKKIVWDATSLIHTQRSAVTRLGFNYNAHVRLIVFHKAQSTINAQNRARTQPVPANVLGNQFKSVDFPYEDEAHEVQYVE